MGGGALERVHPDRRRKRDGHARPVGRADAGSAVIVEFGGKSFSTTAGTGGAWKPAVIDQYERPSKHFSRKITVSSKDVPEPKALRYCHERPFAGTLYGDNALPVAPFELVDPSYDKTTRESTLMPVPANADPDGWWMKRHAEKLAEIAANKDRRYDVVMIGDSITHFLESKPERGGEAYAQFTKDFKVLNLGYGGDRTENVIWRELNGELDGYRAKVFTVMIGTNNNDWGDSDPEHVSYGIRRVLTTNANAPTLNVTGGTFENNANLSGWNVTITGSDVTLKGDLSSVDFTVAPGGSYKLDFPANPDKGTTYVLLKTAANTPKPDFDEPKVGPLSRREIDVLTYIAQGKTHEEIGIIGGISAETVRTHMKSILRKLDCANAPAAVSRAYELGILRA